MLNTQLTECWTRSGEARNNLRLSHLHSNRVANGGSIYLLLKPGFYVGTRSSLERSFQAVFDWSELTEGLGMERSPKR
ncbi:MAG: hypothetical protein Ct9H300mP7_6890 [Verrucomicrobiota bacterium]|nr:MAG: hypothetical protein Ct9H300mP7_6890 [Verrucomicrobiota bacterium]